MFVAYDVIIYYITTLNITIMFGSLFHKLEEYLTPV